MRCSVRAAKVELDAGVENARGKFFKAIQIAEILYYDRMHPGEINLADHETYRCASKHWRDVISTRLVGSNSRSNGSWQDNLFPGQDTPHILAILARENRRLGGGVEAYVYRRIGQMHGSIAELVISLEGNDPNEFSLRQFLDQCCQSQLLRVKERIYEIIACAIIATLTKFLDVQVITTVSAKRFQLVASDEILLGAVLGMPNGKPKKTAAGRLSRLGLTSAADGGVDIVSNFGFIAQVKHAALDDRLLSKIYGAVQIEGMTVICRTVTFSSSSGSERHNTALVITENDLVRWSDQIVRGNFGLGAAAFLCENLTAGLRREFPACDPVDFAAFMTERDYVGMAPWKI